LPRSSSPAICFSDCCFFCSASSCALNSTNAFSPAKYGSSRAASACAVASWPCCSALRGAASWSSMSAARRWLTAALSGASVRAWPSSA
jgi:hypothetical protein